MSLVTILAEFKSGRDIQFRAGQAVETDDHGLNFATFVAEGLLQIPFVQSHQAVFINFETQQRRGLGQFVDMMNIAGLLPVFGAGDFSGPAGSVAGNLVSFADATGKLGSDSGVAASAVTLNTIVLTAGAGLTGGGNLTANRIFDVVANADASIVVNANDIQVGVLASDAQHGARGGGTQHAAVVAAGASGFMTGADKTFLDGLAAGAPFLPLAGGTMTGAINMGAQPITNTSLISSLGVLSITPAPGNELRFSTLGDTTRVLGDLVVDGTTTTVDSQTVLIADNHLYLNNGYTVTSAQPGCLVVNYLPTATSDTVNGVYVAGIASTSNPTVVTTAAATFTVGDYIQFSGSTDNDGLYEVLTHAANLLAIRGVGTTGTLQGFSQNQFIAGASDGATITNVTVSVLQSGIDGIWEQAEGSSTTGFTFSDISSLQSAYNGGQTTNMLAATGDWIINATDAVAFQIQKGGTPVISMSTAGAVDIVAAAGENVSLDAPSGEMVFDDVGDSGLTLSQAPSDRVLTETGAGEVQEGTTSVVAAINRLSGASLTIITVSQSTDTTSGAGFVTKGSIVIPAVDADFIIEVSARVSHSTTNAVDAVRMRNVTDGVTLGQQWQNEMSDTDNRHTLNLPHFFQQTVAAGAKTIELQYEVQSGIGTMTISDVIVQARRIFQ